MRFLSVCSGIEAASVAWTPLGWEAVAFSEIEPFPCAVLAHHYPSVPNWGDMTKFQEWPDADVDLLCGGTPCQSFSVAGLRKGLADPRGNLMLTFGAIAAKYRPQWLVWENVPGVLSSNGGDDFKAFLDMLESLGYVCDVEILDAQFFGVPQRRRRVFVCAQHRDDLLSQKTDTSALTITQCLQEILLCILSEARSRFASGQGSSDLPSRSKDGAKRRMELFGLAGEADCWPMLLENLAEAFRRLPQEQRLLGATHGEPGKEPTPGVQSTDSQTESLFTLTEQSLKNALDDALKVMRLFITSTATSSTTQAQIFSCSRAVLLIAQLTQRLSQSSPAFWNSALSSLTAVEEFTDYARSTSSDLFGDLERLQSWCDFIEQAEHSNDTFIGFGVECFGEIFPLPDCLQGHSAPSREAGKVAPTIPSRSTAGGGLGTDFDCDGGTICVATGQAGAEIGADMAPTLNCNHEAPYAMYASSLQPCEFCGYQFDHDKLGRYGCPNCEGEGLGCTHTLRGEGFDASEDGTGLGTPLVPVLPFDTTQITSAANRSNPKAGDPCHPLASQAHVPCIAFSSKDYGGDAMSDLSPTLRAGGHSTSHANAGVMPAIAFPANLSGTQCASTEDLAPSMGATNPTAAAFHENQRGEVTLNDTAGTVKCAGGKPGQGYPAVMQAMQVRRLTPEECEALQGFPRGYTAVPHRGKPAADGPRYKALGNSWAVPNVRWIGRRINDVNAIKQQHEKAA